MHLLGESTICIISLNVTQLVLAGSKNAFKEMMPSLQEQYFVAGVMHVKGIYSGLVCIEEEETPSQRSNKNLWAKGWMSYGKMKASPGISNSKLLPTQSPKPQSILPLAPKNRTATP